SCVNPSCVILLQTLVRPSSSVVVMLSAACPFRDPIKFSMVSSTFGFRASQKFRRFASEFQRRTQDALPEALKSPELAGSLLPIVSAGQDTVGPRGVWPVAASAIIRVGRRRGYHSSLNPPVNSSAVVGSAQTAC